MDLTFQVPMQYCSLQHRILLLSPVTSTTGCCFCFGSIPSFFLELFLHWSPVAYWAPTHLGSSSFSILSFCLFILFLGFSRQECWNGLPLPSPVDHILSDRPLGGAQVSHPSVTTPLAKRLPADTGWLGKSKNTGHCARAWNFLYAERKGKHNSFSGSHIAGFSLIEFLGKQVSYGVGVIKESSSWTEMLYCPLDGLGGQRMTFGTKKNFSFSPWFNWNFIGIVFSLHQSQTMRMTARQLTSG